MPQKASIYTFTNVNREDLVNVNEPQVARCRAWLLSATTHAKDFTYFDSERIAYICAQSLCETLSHKAFIAALLDEGYVCVEAEFNPQAVRVKIKMKSGTMRAAYYRALKNGTAWLVND